MRQDLEQAVVLLAWLVAGGLGIGAAAFALVAGLSGGFWVADRLAAAADWRALYQAERSRR